MDKVIERLEELANITVEPIGYISPVRTREEIIQRLDLCSDYDLAKILMELDDRSHDDLIKAILQYPTDKINIYITLLEV